MDMLMRLTISEYYLQSVPKITQLYKKLYDSIYNRSILIKLSFFISTLFHLIQPIDKEQFDLRQYPVAMYYATDDTLTSESNFNKVVSRIKPTLIGWCINCGHCIQVEDIAQFNKFNIEFFELVNSNAFNNKVKPIQKSVNYYVGAKTKEYILPFSNKESVLVLIFKFLLSKFLVILHLN